MELIDHKPTKKQYIKFAITAVIWILWMIWMRSYWMLIGLPIIFDIFISKKVNWNPFKQKKGEPKKKWKEWADALIFALVVSTIIKIFILGVVKIPGFSKVLHYWNMSVLQEAPRRRVRKVTGGAGRTEPDTKSSMEAPRGRRRH